MVMVYILRFMIEQLAGVAFVVTASVFFLTIAVIYSLFLLRLANKMIMFSFLKCWLTMIFVVLIDMNAIRIFIESV